jgi:hypothetical protein
MSSAATAIVSDLVASLQLVKRWPPQRTIGLFIAIWLLLMIFR